MMISLKIGNEERRNGDIEKRWIVQQLHTRNGQPVCVKVLIRGGDVDMPLKSGACSHAGGSGRHLTNRKENKLQELWNQRGLNGTDINAGMLISFLNEYEQFI